MMEQEWLSITHEQLLGLIAAGFRVRSVFHRVHVLPS